MPVKPMRCYADTSVFGGIEDPEFEIPTARFFSLVQAGQFQLVVSPVVGDEVRPAPVRVREFLREMTAIAETVEVTEEALLLQRRYLRAGVVGAQWDRDALHVALATVANCAVIVSWNFKHIVNFRKIPLYNAINMANGYRSIAIHSPLEVSSDEDEEV